ncbi:MAG TPA: hypothetical protein VNN77_19300 [candidate division Zixibacteria bacterium]|nr:hypothetical protein [candidate division Zixibacteria bacterium]
MNSPQTCTPRQLAEKILASKGALEGERKQVTVLFADMKGSMELPAGRDPEEARTLRRHHGECSSSVAEMARRGLDDQCPRV